MPKAANVLWLVTWDGEARRGSGSVDNYVFAESAQEAISLVLSDMESDSRLVAAAGKSMTMMARAVTDRVLGR